MMDEHVNAGAIVHWMCLRHLRGESSSFATGEPRAEVQRPCCSPGTSGEGPGREFGHHPGGGFLSVDDVCLHCGGVLFVAWEITWNGLPPKQTDFKCPETWSVIPTRGPLGNAMATPTLSPSGWGVPSWRRLCFHLPLGLLLVVSVDDFTMAGPKAHLVKALEMMRSAIRTQPSEPYGLFLGSNHEFDK